MLREEFAFMFQTFSRNDPPGKAPPSRGRSVFKKTIDFNFKMGFLRNYIEIKNYFKINLPDSLLPLPGPPPSGPGREDSEIRKEL
jgi:hypothetical protein